MTPKQRSNFTRMLKPRHIAFIGGVDAMTAVTEARRRGYEGQMWAVNPKRSELAGIPCFASIEELPEAPDAVYLAVPALAVVACVAQLAQMGAGGVVCYSAGFKEAGENGAAAEIALCSAVGDMALIGPNCYGLINYIDNSALWSFAHGGSSPGYGAAIITQSGMFSSDITMSQRSLPMAYMISCGNQAVLSLEDYLDYFCQDPAVRAVGLHIEGLLDIPAFERAALKALKHNTPVVALKTGSSVIGSTLTVSHTGSISGANELYEALFERVGIIGVSNPSQMLETLKYLSVLGAPKGRSLIGFTCSGGGATMLADHAEKIDLRFPPIDSEAVQTLTDLLPDIATVTNPLDYTTPIWGQPEFTSPVFTTAMQAVEAQSAILVQDYPVAGLDGSKILYQKDAVAFAEAAAAINLPAAICATIPENLDIETREYLISIGVAPMQGIHETLNAISQAAWWNKVRDNCLADLPAPLAVSSSSGPGTPVTEDEGKQWVQRAGVAVPKGRCTSGADAAQAADGIGFPVVIKMMGEDLLHKTEAGAVALSIGSSDDADEAVSKMRYDVTNYDTKAITDRFLVEEMSPKPLAELLVNLRRDPQFGTALTLGSGGTLVELVGDAVTLLLPCNQSEIIDALLNLKAGLLLRGFRNSPPADLTKISAAIQQLCAYFVTGSDDVVEVEINPLFAYEDRIVAIDVLLQRTVR